MKVDQLKMRQTIKDVRAIFGWSQRDLAKEFWVSPAAVAGWELGTREIKGPTAKLIIYYHKIATQFEFAAISMNPRLELPLLLEDKSLLKQLFRGKLRIEDELKNRVIERKRKEYQLEIQALKKSRSSNL